MDKISVVTSLYQSAPYIAEFHARHAACLEKMGVDFEFVFVDDGSPDDSAKIVEGLAARSRKVKLVALSRNFGQHAAMFAGLAHAQGNYVYALDCDLEEEPENILEFYQTIRQTPDLDVVYGVIRERAGGFLSRVLGRVFFLILDLFSSVKITPNQGWQRIMTRRYVEALLRYTEVETLPAGLMALAGFAQKPLTIEKKYKGSTSYSFKKRFGLAVNSITAFSSRPLALICLFGLGLTLLSFLAILAIVAVKLSGYNFQTGWVSVIASIWCVGGLILFSVGVMGIYLSKVFNQVKGRPLYIVKNIVTSAD